MRGCSNRNLLGGSSRHSNPFRSCRHLSLESQIERSVMPVISIISLQTVFSLKIVSVSIRSAVKWTSGSCFITYHLHSSERDTFVSTRKIIYIKEKQQAIPSYTDGRLGLGLNKTWWGVCKGVFLYEKRQRWIAYILELKMSVSEEHGHSFRPRCVRHDLKHIVW